MTSGKVLPVNVDRQLHLYCSSKCNAHSLPRNLGSVFTCTFPSQLLWTLAHSLLTVCSQSAHSLLTVCSQSAHSLLTVCSQSAHSLLAVCSQSAHSLLTVCSQSCSQSLAHSLLTVCSQSCSQSLAHSLLLTIALDSCSVSVECCTFQHDFQHDLFFKRTQKIAPGCHLMNPPCCFSIINPCAAVLLLITKLDAFLLTTKQAHLNLPVLSVAASGAGELCLLFCEPVIPLPNRPPNTYTYDHLTLILWYRVICRWHCSSFFQQYYPHICG